MIRYAIGYLAVMALLWATALPKHLTAVNGVTDHGDPIGNLWYTISCFFIAGVCIAAALSTTKRDAPVAHKRGLTTHAIPTARRALYVSAMSNDFDPAWDKAFTVVQHVSLRLAGPSAP